MKSVKGVSEVGGVDTRKKGTVFEVASRVVQEEKKEKSIVEGNQSSFPDAVVPLSLPITPYRSSFTPSPIH